MTNKIISIEDKEGVLQATLRRVMRMVPEKDKSDPKLKRMIAFRLKTDGEAKTSEFLVSKIREIIQCRYSGSFYEFIKDDLKKAECQGADDIK